MERAKEKNNRRWWRWGLLAAAIIGLLFVTGWTLHEVEEVEDTTCPVSEHISCSTGNACIAPNRRRICPQSEDGPRQPPDVNTTLGCSNPNYVCENLPYPDGTCCNKNDFCYRDDPFKTCQQGVCTSSDPTLCRGFCESDDDCIFSDTPFPIYDAADSTVFCAGGACFAYVQTLNPVNGPGDLLNMTTLLQRNTSACLEMSCFQMFAEDSCTVFQFQYCQYAWACSRYNGLDVRKRDIAGAMAASQVRGKTLPYVTSEGVTVDVPVLHNFTLPGGGRYSRQLYQQANAALNYRLGQFIASVDAKYTEAPTGAPTGEPTGAPTGEPTPAPTAEAPQP
jgi:hypothetical protein